MIKLQIMSGFNHEIFMQRCLQLAHCGEGYTAPNPMVGSLLLYEDRIIGEGYHQRYGEAHAEVNCIESVLPENRHLIPGSTLYVSLEPCAHHGKTAPCADRIIKEGIRNVVVGCRDPFELVNGKGIEKLKAAAVEVVNGILEKECIGLNKRFFTFHTKQRPYILLKWAQTKNQIIGNSHSERLMISNSISDRLVHKWRATEAGILVGTNTALKDDPALSNRWWTGKNPIRSVIDLDLKLPGSLKLFDDSLPTMVFNTIREEKQGNIFFSRISRNGSLLQQIMQKYYAANLLSVMVEGGASLIQSFINEGLWDEARIITNTSLEVSEGIKAPSLKAHTLKRTDNYSEDVVSYYHHH